LAIATLLGRVRRGQGCRRLASDFPDLYPALEIYGDEDRDYRWALEAQLLAGGSRLRLAANFGLAETVIANYAAIFFDVADRLDNVDFIIPAVIGPQPHERYEFHNSGWKTLAYLGGPGILSFVPAEGGGVGGLVGLQLSATRNAVAGWMRWRIENGGDCHLRLLRDLTRIVGYLDDRADENGPVNPRSENIKQFFKGLRISDETQKLIEKHPDFVGNDEMKATVKTLEVLGLWGPDLEEPETSQRTPESDSDDPAAAAEQ
jgi:hypothetical protein